jgi:hypothetical protein
VVAAEERRPGSLPRIGGTVGAACRGGPPCRGRRCAGRADVGTAELAGVGRRCCARVGEERQIVEERRGASERSGTTLRGEAAAVRTGASRKKGAILGKTVKCPGGLYRTHTFCRDSY